MHTGSDAVLGERLSPGWARRHSTSELAAEKSQQLQQQLAHVAGRQGGQQGGQHPGGAMQRLKATGPPRRLDDLLLEAQGLAAPAAAPRARGQVRPARTAPQLSLAQPARQGSRAAGDLSTARHSSRSVSAHSQAAADGPAAAVPAALAHAAATAQAPSPPGAPQPGAGVAGVQPAQPGTATPGAASHGAQARQPSSSPLPPPLLAPPSLPRGDSGSSAATHAFSACVTLASQVRARRVHMRAPAYVRVVADGPGVPAW
jgi:hypothetical protein